MRYWTIRTDRHHAKDLIAPELRAGRLRQGWGWDEEQDLRRVHATQINSIALTVDQRQAWQHARRLLPGQADGVADGDLLLLPNVPVAGVWSIARAGADYDFAVSPNTEDHGHIRTVELLREGINPHSPAVSAPLRATMRCQLSHWNIDLLGTAVEALLDTTPLGVGVDVDADNQRLVSAFTAAQAVFADQLAHAYTSTEFEEPVQRLLSGLFDHVEWCAGPAEHGADFLCHHRDALGCDHLIAVQLKMWQGLATHTAALEQLRTARRYWPGVTSLVLLTTADDVTHDFDQARRMLQSELGLPVQVVCRDRLLALLLASLASDQARIPGKG